MGLPEGQHPVNVLKDDERVKGGKSLSPLKILANSTRRRKYCSLTCAFADSCPVLPLAMSKEETLPDGKQPCKLRAAPPGVQRRVKRMFLDGETGLLDEIRSALFVAGNNLGADVKERLAYADAIGRLHERIYGEKSTVRNPEPLEITVTQYNLNREGPYASSEIKVINQDRAQALIDRNKPPEDIPENDADSLFNSPALDAIIVKKHNI